MTIALCFDTETTGNKVEKDRIVEICVVLKELESWKNLVSYTRRFNPQIHITAGALAVHGIADADVMGEPILETAAPLIVKMLERADVVIGHNIIGFDIPLLVNELVRCGVTLPSRLNVVDTMLEGLWATPDGKFPTLGELCWALDVPYDLSKAHAASYDVECNLQAYKRGLDLGYYPQPVVARKEAA